MSRDPLETLPPVSREAGRTALAEVLGCQPITAVASVAGGSSGARLFRVASGRTHLLLRVEGPESPLLKRNPHRWTALRQAAAAGVAPPTHYVNEATGVTISDFIDQRPLGSYPGGARALVGALGELVRRLQAGPVLPPLVDYRELVGEMLMKVRASGVFAYGLLDPHLEELAHISARCDWEPKRYVSSHNDPNPGNILFDGRRLWLIDWEAGYANDALIDIGIIADCFAPTPELEDALLQAWAGTAADAALRGRLGMVRRLTRLYYACFLIDAGAADTGDAPYMEVAPPRAQAIRVAIAEGRLGRGSAEAAAILGKVFLQSFLTGEIDPAVREAITPLL